ncbi:MAG: polysaccharide deacetylase family protein [Peptococcaceae bacterium]|nr:polysaccharide deacetylase family protein [Peptococcaceae bacterium]
MKAIVNLNDHLFQAGFIAIIINFISVLFCLPVNSDTTLVHDFGHPTTPYVFKFPEKGIPVLMYHSISTIPNNTLGIPVEQFKEEMQWLYNQNYHPLSLEEFYEALVNEAPVPEKPILLTFDDGYLDNYSAAWPVLQQHHFRATFFIVTGSLGPGMMDWKELQDLKDHGNSIGSHTVNHYDLRQLSSGGQEDELSASKQVLDEHLGINVQAFCFPSGRYNNRTLELMPQLGYKLGFTTIPGNVHLGDNPLTLKRVRISGGMSFVSFQKLFP